MFRKLSKVEKTLKEKETKCFVLNWDVFELKIFSDLTVKLLHLQRSGAGKTIPIYKSQKPPRDSGATKTGTTGVLA